MEERMVILQNLFKQGSGLLQAGKYSEALALFQEALSIDPSFPTLHLYAGAALHSLGRFEEAAECYGRALDIAPDMGEAHNNLGNSLMALGHFSKAADSFSRAVALLQPSPVPLTARATALQALGRVADAEADCRKALSIAPDFAAAHWNLALIQLLQGNFAEGWREYEWRWLKPDFSSPCRHLDTPLWDGSSLDERTILLHAEQGFGDAIQFIRYAPLVAQRGGTVVIECHPQLVRLMKSVEGVADVIPFGEALPPFDCQCPLLTLPRIFGTTLQTIPADCPYLYPDNICQEKWRFLIPDYSGTLRIGLVWAGKGYPDPLRSCRLAELAPLAESTGFSFYSLQMGPGSEQAAAPPGGMPLTNLTGHIDDFADTAACIERLDLVISIDTAVAHLAGALGKPAYIMIPYAPDWRWLLDRNDSPWYPSARIFRQEQSGDWSGVVSRIRSRISAFREQNKKSFGAAPKD